MQCLYPTQAVMLEGRLRFDHDLVKRYGKSALLIPCKRCISCRMSYRGEWEQRMMDEYKTNDYQGQFLTLTLNPENLTANFDLDRTLMQKFWKRYRKSIAPQKLRFVQCGEYGGKTSRPHYHAIVFGHQFDDLEPYSRNRRGETLYESETLDKLWGLGQCKIGSISPQSCGYVAGYMLKDSKGNYDPKKPYTTINTDTGELIERVRPFASRSNRPGIGKHWFDRYWKDLFPHDFRVLRDGTRVAVPTYYYNKLEEKDPDMYRRVKLKRERSIDPLYLFKEGSPGRVKARKACLLAKINHAKRGSLVEPQQTVAYTTDAIEESK